VVVTAEVSSWSNTTSTDVPVVASLPSFGGWCPRPTQDAFYAPATIVRDSLVSRILRDDVETFRKEMHAAEFNDHDSDDDDDDEEEEEDSVGARAPPPTPPPTLKLFTDEGGTAKYNGVTGHGEHFPR
jgi:hypothetical protein